MSPDAPKRDPSAPLDFIAYEGGGGGLSSETMMPWASTPERSHVKTTLGATFSIAQLERMREETTSSSQHHRAEIRDGVLYVEASVLWPPNARVSRYWRLQAMTPKARLLRRLDLGLAWARAKLKEFS